MLASLTSLGPGNETTSFRNAPAPAPAPCLKFLAGSRAARLRAHAQPETAGWVLNTEFAQGFGGMPGWHTR